MNESTPTRRINWIASLFLTFTLLAALIGAPVYIATFGLAPWLAILSLFYIFATGMSITLGYHRLFAHRAFTAKWPVRFGTLLFGACAFEDSALDWSSDHRKHHKHVDHEEDPYNISKGFFWAHMGWIFFKLYPRRLDNVRDLEKDPLVMWQHRYHRWIAGIVGLILPALIGLVIAGWTGALGGFLIAGITRLVVVHHSTFLINSLCHTVGNRPYDSRTSARDSWIMALLTFGEGYHNYHHSFQHDYRNGVKPWHFDPTKWTIWLLEKAGLASDLRRVPQAKIVLAELREARRRAEAETAALLAAPTVAQGCSQWRAAVAKFQELSSALGEGYAELEDAVAQRVEVSRSRLETWRDQAADMTGLITQLSRLRLAYEL